jgi:hypothetical protein
MPPTTATALPTKPPLPLLAPPPQMPSPPPMRAPALPPLPPLPQSLPSLKPTSPPPAAVLIAAAATALLATASASHTAGAPILPPGARPPAIPTHPTAARTATKIDGPSATLPPRRFGATEAWNSRVANSEMHSPADSVLARPAAPGLFLDGGGFVVGPFWDEGRASQEREGRSERRSAPSGAARSASSSSPFS